MAETRVINVSTIDEDGKQTTFNLDNPIENITKNQIVTAFNYGIQNGLIMSNNGTKVISVGTTTLTTSNKVIIEGEPVYITPNKISLVTGTWYNEAKLTATVTVQNADIQAAQVTNIQLNKGETEITSDYFYQTLNVNNGNITINFISINEETANSSGSANLIIIINGTTYNVPITFSQN